MLQKRGGIKTSSMHHSLTSCITPSRLLDVSKTCPPCPCLIVTIQTQGTLLQQRNSEYERGGGRANQKQALETE